MMSSRIQATQAPVPNTHQTEKNIEKENVPAQRELPFRTETGWRDFSSNKPFLIRKEGIFCPGKEIEGLRGGVLRYVAQAIAMIDTARAEKHPFRTETG